MSPCSIFLYTFVSPCIATKTCKTFSHNFFSSKKAFSFIRNFGLPITKKKNGNNVFFLSFYGVECSNIKARAGSYITKVVRCKTNKALLSPR